MLSSLWLSPFTLLLVLLWGFWLLILWLAVLSGLAWLSRLRRPTQSEYTGPRLRRFVASTRTIYLPRTQRLGMRDWYHVASLRSHFHPSKLLEAIRWTR